MTWLTISVGRKVDSALLPSCCCFGMTTAAISSLPCCAAMPECPTALEAAAAARFGDGIFAFGAFVMKAVGRHLARGAQSTMARLCSNPSGCNRRRRRRQRPSSRPSAPGRRSRPRGSGQRRLRSRARPGSVARPRRPACSEPKRSNRAQRAFRKFWPFLDGGNAHLW